MCDINTLPHLQPLLSNHLRNVRRIICERFEHNGRPFSGNRDHQEMINFTERWGKEERIVWTKVEGNIGIV